MARIRRSEAVVVPSIRLDVARPAADTIRGARVGERRAFRSVKREGVVAKGEAIFEASTCLSSSDRAAGCVAVAADLVHDAVVVGDVGTVVAGTLSVRETDRDDWWRWSRGACRGGHHHGGCG